MVLELRGFKVGEGGRSFKGVVGVSWSLGFRNEKLFGRVKWVLSGSVGLFGRVLEGSPRYALGFRVRLLGLSPELSTVSWGAKLLGSR